MSFSLRAINWLVDAATGMVFRTMDVRRRGAEPTGADLILASHAGGFADILLVIKASTRFPRFLARDVIWTVPVAAWAMNTVRGIPVHRREDHHGQANNDGMFDAAYEALEQGDVVAIYPEGESVPEPRLAPLRTGAARIALGALARGADISISPMGLHYFDVSVLRTRAMVDCGESFTISSVVEELGSPGPVTEDNHDLVHAVTNVFAERLGAVSNHFDDWEELRELQVAASSYLRHKDPEATISYSDISSLATELANSDHEEQVKTAAAAFVSELELLGVNPQDVPRGAMASARLVGEAFSVALMAPVAAVGLVVNFAGIMGLRLISLTGMAPATAASVKPLYAALAFPASWIALGRFGYKHGGGRAGLVMTLLGPVSLAAAMRVGERGQLLWRLSRALHRAKGPLLEQVGTARKNMIEAVDHAINDDAERSDEQTAPEGAALPPHDAPDSAANGVEAEQATQ